MNSEFYVSVTGEINDHEQQKNEVLLASAESFIMQSCWIPDSPYGGGERISGYY